MPYTYGTSEIARIVGVHPNTVRLYEELGLIPKPERRPNGYRIFTEIHLEQLRLIRTAFQVEVLQNGLRNQATEIVKTAAAGDFDKAQAMTRQYLRQIEREQAHAEEAVEIAAQTLLRGPEKPDAVCFTRRQAADCLEIPADTLRNWERNGLLRGGKQKGRCVYRDSDIRRLKIIRALRRAGYSLTSILRMMNKMSRDPQADLRAVIDTPGKTEDIISACDRLLSSLRRAGENGRLLLTRLAYMRHLKKENPPL